MVFTHESCNTIVCCNGACNDIHDPAATLAGTDRGVGTLRCLLLERGDELYGLGIGELPFLYAFLQASCINVFSVL